MKRILLGFMRDGTGGVDIYIKKLILDLQNYDCCVDILSNTGTQELYDYFSGLKNIRIEKVHSLKKPFAQLRDISKIITQRKYDIAYFNISEAINCIGILAASFGGIHKIILHSHSSGIDINPGLSRVIHMGLHILARSLFIGKFVTDYVACSNKAAKWMFPRKVYLSGHYLIVYNNIDLSLFQFDEEKRKENRKKWGLDEKIVVGSVGRYCYAKNNFFYVDIMEKLLEFDDNIVFLSIGDGIILKNVQEYARKKHVESNMIFAGKCNNVQEILHVMDIFILPSFFEGLPFSVLEAQAEGVPCLISARVTSELAISDSCKFIEGFDALNWAKEIIILLRSGRKIGDISCYRNKCIESREKLFNLLEIEA